MIIICSRTIPEISHRIFAPHNHQDLQGEQNSDPLSASTDNRKGHQSRRNILPSSRSRNVCSLNDFCSSLSPQSIRIPSRTLRVVWGSLPWHEHATSCLGQSASCLRLANSHVTCSQYELSAPELVARNFLHWPWEVQRVRDLCEVRESIVVHLAQEQNIGSTNLL